MVVVSKNRERQRSGMRLLGDVVGDVVDRLERKVCKRTFNNTLNKTSSERVDQYRVPNDPRLEWMFICLSGKSKAEQKRLILQARHPSVGFLTDADADVLISGLVLEDA
jgi:hypothetical protein